LSFGDAEIRFSRYTESVHDVRSPAFTSYLPFALRSIPT
jgi:hypothetical protein